MFASFKSSSVKKYVHFGNAGPIQNEKDYKAACG